MITPAEAWKLVCGHVRALPVRNVEPDAAAGCTLAGDVVADRDIPASDRSAMDGYAVRAADLEVVPVTLAVQGEVAAGARPPDRAICRGECVRIFTGAVIPPGADTVVMVEDTSAASGPSCTSPGNVTVLKKPAAGANIFKRAENAVAGEILVPAGTTLTAAHISVCASIGAKTVPVYERPRVSVLSSGDELQGADDPVESHQIRDSNRSLLVATLAGHGFEVVKAGRVSDSLERLVEAIVSCLAQSNVVIMSGGVSAGNYDFVPKAVAQAGGQIIFHHVAMKPGKPVLCAVFPDGRLLWGLPGNPLSCVVGLHALALPSLYLMSGVPPELCCQRLLLPVAGAVSGKGERLEYRLGRLTERNGLAAVEPVASTGSGDLIAAGRADGLFVMPAGVRTVVQGAPVEFMPWRRLR